MQKKSFEVLIKLRAVLILDLPDFIRGFILNLKNKLGVVYLVVGIAIVLF